MKLVTLQRDGSPRAGALVAGDRVLDFSRAAAALAEAGRNVEPVPDSIRAMLESDDLDAARRLVDQAQAAEGSLRDALTEAGALMPADAVRLAAPIPEPRLILALGMAYRDHLAEMNVDMPPEPTAFLKAPSSVTGPGSDIVLPARHPDMVDYEGEFSLVIGRVCHDVEPDEAMACVAGYTIVNDVSARDWVTAALNPDQSQMEAALSWMVNLHGKQFPTFTPMGPALVTADEIADPHDLHLTTRLNGQVMQAAHTDDLVYRIPGIIAYFSRWYRFSPGDVITTGSPAGVGFARTPPVYLRPGDVIEVEVSNIGTLSNPVVRAGGDGAHENGVQFG